MSCTRWKADVGIYQKQPVPVIYSLANGQTVMDDEEDI